MVLAGKRPDHRRLTRVRSGSLHSSYSWPVPLIRPVRFRLRRSFAETGAIASALLMALSGALGIVPSVHAAQSTQDVVRSSTNYSRALLALDDDVTLWRPTYTASLRRNGPIDVIAYGKGGKRATFAGSTYGKRVPSFTLSQKAAQTRWAATPVSHETAGLVRTPSIRLKDAGNVRVRVFANCRQPGTAPRSCTAADVAKFGGTAELLARSTVNGDPRATTVRIDSNGLTYRQLLRVARGLVPVS